MKPAEAESSSGLRDHQTRLTNFEPTTTIFQLPKEKKLIPRRSIDSNCPDTRTVCYGSDVCTNNFGSGNRVVPATWQRQPRVCRRRWQSRRRGVRTEVRGR